MESETPINLTTTSILKWVPVMKVLIFCGGFLICFLIAYTNGSVSAYVPFISEIGARIPECILFSLTLYFGAVAGSVTILYRFLIIRFQLRLMENRFNKINRVSTISGLISMIAMVGVAAVPMSTVFPLHLFFGGAHFLFALIYMNLQDYISFHLTGRTTTWNKIREGFCNIFLLLVLSSVFSYFLVSQIKWSKANLLAPPALKTPNDPFFILMMATSIMEWMLYATFLAIIYSYFFEFNNFKLQYAIVPCQNGGPETSIELRPLL